MKLGCASWALTGPLHFSPACHQSWGGWEHGWRNLNDKHYLPPLQPSLAVAGVQGIVQRGSGEEQLTSDIEPGPQHFAGALTYLACTALETNHPGNAVTLTFILSAEGHGAPMTGVRQAACRC